MKAPDDRTKHPRSKGRGCFFFVRRSLSAAVATQSADVGNDCISPAADFVPLCPHRKVSQPRRSPLSLPHDRRPSISPPIIPSRSWTPPASTFPNTDIPHDSDTLIDTTMAPLEGPWIPCFKPGKPGIGTAERYSRSLPPLVRLIMFPLFFLLPFLPFFHP